MHIKRKLIAKQDTRVILKKKKRKEFRNENKSRNQIKFSNSWN